MIFLQRFYLNWFCLKGFYSPDCSQGGCHGSDIRNFVYDCCLAYVCIIRLACLATRGVDYHLDIAILDNVGDMWTFFMHLIHKLRFNAIFSKKFTCAPGRHNFETEISETPCNIDHCRLVFVRNSDEHSSFKWQATLGSVLRLVECHPEGFCHSQHFSS